MGRSAKVTDGITGYGCTRFAVYIFTLVLITLRGAESCSKEARGSISSRERDICGYVKVLFTW